MRPSVTIRAVSTVVLSLLAALLLAGPAHAQDTYPPALTAPTVSSSTPVLGDVFTATARGFAPAEPVSATVFSDPVALGTRAADAAGAVTFSVDTDRIGVGPHRMVFTGDSGRTVTAEFTVLAATSGAAGGTPGTGGGLASTGDDVAHLGATGAALVALGLGTLVLARRRAGAAT